MVLPELHFFQHFPGRTAAVITNPRQPQGLIDPCIGKEALLFQLHGQRIGVRTDRRQHQRQHLLAAASSPAEQTVREDVGGIPGQFVRAEPANSRGLCDGWKPARKSETIRQPGQVMSPLWKLPLTGLLTQCELPPQRSRADKHTVGFHPGAIDGLPAPESTGLLNTGEQRGAVALAAARGSTRCCAANSPLRNE